MKRIIFLLLKSKIFYFIIVIIISANDLQSLEGQTTIDYWTIGNNLISVNTKNGLGQITDTKSYNINNNTFYWNNSLVYLKPDVFALYPEGEGKLNKLISDSLNCYGCESLINIGVYAYLIISDTGVIRDIGIMRSGGFENDVNVLNFLNKISLFNPAIQNGIPVYSLLILPLRFFGK